MTSNLSLRPNVCMLVFNRELKLFLGERRGNPGHWQFPQGGVESGLSLEDNVIRELKEEIGVKRRHLGIIKKLDATFEYEWDEPPKYARGRWRGQSQTFWLVEFLGTDEDIELERDPDPEFMAWRWCSVEEVQRLAAPRRLAGYTAALEEFERICSQRGHTAPPTISKK